MKKLNCVFLIFAMVVSVCANGQEKAGKSTVVSFDPVVVFVNNKQAGKEIVINIELWAEIADVKGSDLEKALVELKPWAKKQTKAVIEGFTFKELMSPESKFKIKKSMKEKIENHFKKNGKSDFKIKDILIASFIIAG